MDYKRNMAFSNIFMANHITNVIGCVFTVTNVCDAAV